MVCKTTRNKAGEHVICAPHVSWDRRAIPWSLNRKHGDLFYIAGAQSDGPGDDESLVGFDVKERCDDIRSEFVLIRPPVALKRAIALPQ